MCLYIHTPVCMCSVCVYQYAYVSNLCGCVRAHAGNGERFLEDGLAGKLSLYRHGYQPSGGGQGEFIIQEITKCVYVCLMKRSNNRRGIQLHKSLIQVFLSLLQLQSNQK